MTRYMKINENENKYFVCEVCSREKN